MAGRRNLYDSLVKPKLSTISGMYRDGHTLEEIADYLGIALSTLCNYRNQHPELDEALKRGNAEAVYEVENALFKSCIGYYYTEEEINKKTGEVVEVTKYAKPNTTSMIFWLKNRAPNGKWSDKQEHDVNVSQVIFEGEDDIKE